MIIAPKIRGFICTTAHPAGCAAHVQEQIDHVKSSPLPDYLPKNVLVIGASTGYGLASRIVPAFSAGAATLGVFFEKAPSERKTASAGWYNSAAFEAAAVAEGIYARSINGDAFSDEVKQRAISEIKASMGPIDCVVYSLASPRRTDPKDGQVYRSCLKPIGQPYSQKNINTDKALVDEVVIDSASEEEIAATVKVMGGEDWELWIEALMEAGVLADEVTSIAYSYIGPELTWPIYRDGTIGMAKNHLEQSCARIRSKLDSKGGRAFVSVNKAVVTQASSAIPVVPLYISILFKKMKEEGVHEDCIEQIQRMFTDHLGAETLCDEAGRIRIDDLEMREDIQAHVAASWDQITSENLRDLSDFEGYQDNFLKLFGFGLPGVDYDADYDPMRSVDLVQ
jgi:enoyl-[acyl-carrier protein] reductase/trans-2-enoyl-CoA reductase (NAD+)